VSLVKEPQCASKASKGLKHVNDLVRMSASNRNKKGNPSVEGPGERGKRKIVRKASADHEKDGVAKG